MRRERVTYREASEYYHHVMNRGYGGNDIFTGNKNKSQKNEDSSVYLLPNG